MSEFKLSEEIDEDEIFLLNLSQLNNRIDPKYNKFLQKYKRVFNNSSKFSELLIEKPMYGANERAVDYNGYCRYIRITDINEFGLLKNKGVKSAEYENLQYKLEFNDILFARSGATVGKAYIHKDKILNAIFAGYMIKFKVDDTKVSPDYIFIYTQLNVYNEWVQAIQRSAGQPNINAEEYQSLDIPIPPKQIQQNIIDIMDKAYLSKQQKEQQAKELLESIDTYLLDELGITLPELDNSLDKRIFEVRLSDVSSYRTDAEAYLPYYDEVYKAIGNTKYDLQYLNKVVFRVNRRFKAKTAEEYKYIQLGSIGIDSSEVIKPLNIRLPEIPSRAQQIVKTGEILFAIANPQWGTHILVKKENNNFIASSGFIILDSDENNNNYITEVLRSNLYKKLYEKYLTGSGLFLNISTKDLLSLKIPLPPIEKQNEIAEHIQALRDESKQLKLEAVQELERAKAEVENIILGEN